MFLLLLTSACSVLADDPATQHTLWICTAIYVAAICVTWEIRRALRGSR
jgi:hypothetical protein